MQISFKDLDSIFVVCLYPLETECCGGSNPSGDDSGTSTSMNGVQENATTTTTTKEPHIATKRNTTTNNITSTNTNKQEKIPEITMKKDAAGDETEAVFTSNSTSSTPRGLYTH